MKDDVAGVDQERSQLRRDSCQVTVSPMAPADAAAIPAARR